MDTTTSPLASIGVEIGKVASARLVSTAVVAAIGAGEAFERGRDFGAWLGLVPRQYSTAHVVDLSWAAYPSEGVNILEPCSSRLRTSL